MRTKPCPKCNKEGQRFHRNSSTSDGLSYACADCENARHRNPALRESLRMSHRANYRGYDSALATSETRRVIQRASNNKYLNGLRQQVRSLLGACCAECGTAVRLEIHHTDFSGEEHRLQTGGLNARYYCEILEEIKAGSVRYSLLCYACHAAADLDYKCEKFVDRLCETGKLHSKIGLEL